MNATQTTHTAIKKQILKELYQKIADEFATRLVEECYNDAGAV